jgi:hypothetical protein
MTTAVIGFNETHCAYLFDSLDTATPGDDEEKLADDEQLFSGYLPFESLENRIRQRLAAFSEPVVSAKDRHSQLSQALSMSLCCTCAAIPII